MNVKEQTTQHKQPKQSKQPAAWVRVLFGGWILAFRDVYSGLIIPYQQNPSSAKSGILLVAALIITWFVYVPIHELLHVAGCVITGGSVSELVMGKEYGAGFLSRIFPFITPATTQYAGRVTGFEPNGDAGYLVTVFAPYILTLFPGVWFIGHAARTGKLWLFGPGIVMGLASFYNLTGDYFEIGTIVTTRIAHLLTGGRASESISAFWELRSDDIFRLISEISESPASYGMDHASGITVTSSVIIAGLFAAVVFAGWTYILGRRISGRRSVRFETFSA